MVGETAVSGYPLERQNRHRLLNHYEDFEVGRYLITTGGGLSPKRKRLGSRRRTCCTNQHCSIGPMPNILDIATSQLVPFLYTHRSSDYLLKTYPRRAAPSLDRMTCSSTLLFFRVIRCSRVQECCRADYRAAAAALALSSGRPLEPIRMGLRWFPFDAAISFHAATQRHGRRGKDHEFWSEMHTLRALRPVRSMCIVGAVH